MNQGSKAHVFVQHVDRHTHTNIRIRVLAEHWKLELTLGLNGGSRMPFSRCVQLMSLKKGCALTSSKPVGP